MAGALLLRRLEPAHRLVHERRPGVPADEAWTQPLFALFEAQASATPDEVAVVMEQRRITYGALRDEALELARRLWAAMPDGPRPVLVPVRQGPDQMVAQLACLRLGVPHVPSDPSQSVLRQRHIALRTAPLVVACLAAGRELAATLAGEDPVVVIDDDDGRAGELPELPPPTRPATVMFTSGSTGVPKGVVLSQAEVAEACRLRALTYAMGPGDRVALTASPQTIAMFHGGLAPLLWGARIAVLPDSSTLSSVVAGLEAHAITHFSGYIGFLRALVKHPDAGRALAGLRLLGLVGDKVGWSEIASLRATLPSSCRISHDYGMTECSWIAGWMLPRERDGDQGTVALGYAQPGLELWLAGRSEAAATEPERGGLGVGLARGRVAYWREPGQDAARLVDHPEDPAKVVLLTGDIVACAADGLLSFVGRADDQVKVRGWRVEPGDIEAAALQAPAVGAAGIVARRGESGTVRALALHVAPKAGLTIDSERLSAHLRRSLPRHMWPAEIVVSDALPLTATHKVDRARLTELDARHLDRAAPAEASPDTAWPDPLARRIAAAIAEELELAALPAEASFGALGGDSLRALAAALHIEKVFGLTLDPALLLGEEPLGGIVAGIARTVTAALPDGPRSR